MLAVVLLVVGIACGTQSTATSPAVVPTAAPTHTNPATARAPEPTSAAAAPTPTRGQSGAATSTPPPPRRTSAAAAADQGRIIEDAKLVRLGPEPPTLDPHLTADTDSTLYIVEIYGGLVTIDRNLQIVPDLAKDWEIIDDGRTYVFHLREDAKFQDGKPVTAQDFKWSLERASNPETQAPVVDVFLGDIVGFKDMIQGRATSIEGIQVIDDQTLSITIDAPKASFLAKLTYPTAYVLDRENVEGNARWFEEPNGTGPFKLDEYVPGEVIRLQRNEFYHLGSAKLEEVKFILSGGDALLMYENDEIDVTGVGLISLEAILDPSNPLNKEVLQAPPSFDVSFVGLNSAKPPLDDLKVRQALNYAVDKETLSTVLMQGLVTPAKGILPPSFPGYNPDIQGYEYDPDKARQTLRESKYEDNLEDFPRIKLTLPGSFGAAVSPVMEAIIQTWREDLGIEIEILQTEWAIFLQDLHQRRFQMFGGLSWTADYPDPENFLDGLFYSDSSNNNTKYSNLKVDVLLEEARLEQDEEARFAIYHKVEEMVLADATWVPLWHGTGGYVLVKPNVNDYFLFPMIIPRFRYVYKTEE